MGKTTDELVGLAAAVNENPPTREMDRLLSTGEQVSMALLAMAIDARGYPSDLNGTFDGKQIKAVGDGAIILVGFCYDPGTGLEYAWGEYTWTDGVKGYIGLIR